ncbi:hypothetical protein DB30_00669 [Enhygromyxa salina]|uniref:Uncharacterized protein n=1 Tax=Enhygromyxa salina TaxID=215803 RepID=A0A0C1ZLH5_9BACT|nr:DUF2931 family protein [Enhygromyxa salina]KIG18384.1 hypothetical protein DB30_00669 [Enhygromyxa salina]
MTTPGSSDTFEWLPTECADERYPMQLIAGQAEWAGDSVRVPSGKIVNNGWGEIGSRHLVGEPQKPVPARVTLAWFSYTEDQFFAGTLELPHAELTALFRAGFKDPLTGNRASWDKLIVGMGLGGWTSAWLAGSGHVRAVASAQLEPTQRDWSEVLDNPDISRATFIGSKLRARLSDAQLRAHAKHGPPVSAWPKYARRYRWRLHVEGVQVPLHVSMRSFNGERDTYDFARQPPPDELHTVPKQLQITWLTRGAGKLLTKIALDEQEVFGAFDKACTAGADTPTPTLRIELGPRNRVSISVGPKDGPISLTRAKIELLSLPE